MKMIDLRVTRCVWDALLLEKQVGDHWAGFLHFLSSRDLRFTTAIRRATPFSFCVFEKERT